ncbi:Hypothetical predicted protein [Paramuricea clavata]|uniref:Uncharacterized protein n=1 Tax=Paramuricea clavata TaxID=317549 RepID=A0A6S7HJU7_PARCT|nr:Hypothetical predicted protein [Paramuricea clavata]
MSLKCQVVLVWLICLSCKVVVTGCEVVWINRNVTDSFRVGKNGCTNDTSVCKSNATCQSNGSCLCNPKRPTYRNPIIVNGSKIVHGDSYGCIDNEIIRFGAGNASTDCAFGPFQVIPYSHNEVATNFCYDDNPTLLRCALHKAWVKFPDNATEMELPWLNESYVHLNGSNKTLHFKWKRSVPELQGTIITFNLNCSNSSGFYILRPCLRAKVLGKWSADDASTSAADQSPSVKMNFPPKLTSSDLSPTSSITLGALSSSDDDPSSTILVIAIVVPAVVLILLVVVVCFCCKRKRRNRRPFRHTESSLRGPNAYVDLPESDTTETFGAHTNLACPTPEKQSVIVEAHPSHGTVDLQKGKINEVNFYSNPDYEPEDMAKMDEVNASTFISDPDYATVDIKRKKVDDKNSYPEPGYETPDIKRKDVDAKNSYSDRGVNRATSKSNPDYATVDNKRKKVDGNNSYADPGYATPDVKRKDVDAKNSYSDPGYESADMKMKGVNVATSKSFPDYATVDIKRKDVGGKNAYAESAYESAHLKSKDVDGATSSTNNNYETIAEALNSTVKNKDATTYQQKLGYETPDMKRGNVNAASSDSTYSTIDRDSTKVDENAGYSPANIKRIEVNGDLYALPTKKK